MIRHENFPLSTILYYRIGGTARFLLEASSRDDVLRAVDLVSAQQVGRLVVVGLGSNLLFPDGLFDGAVLRIVAGDQRQIRGAGESLVEAFAGETLDDVINVAFEQGCSGLEWAGGLPGTVGAAVRGNVGAFGGELKDVLHQAEVLEIAAEGPQIRSLAASDLHFSYRDSAIKRNRRLIVLSATFRLRCASPEELERAREKYRAHIEYRQQNHPMDYPTCGSVFKNIDGSEQVARILAAWPDVREAVETRWRGKVSMGYIINRLGMAGFRIGGAQVSTKHKNFIVNLGDASFSDVNSIIDEIKGKVFATFGFIPEAEVEIVGE